MSLPQSAGQPGSSCPFAKGDAVRRKGGGPVMSVTQVDPPYYAYRVHCRWEEGGTQRARFFRAEELERADPPRGRA
jgi:uncharacterized protein YodC (DUF2158 family)